MVKNQIKKVPIKNRPDVVGTLYLRFYPLIFFYKAKFDNSKSCRR